LHVTGAGASPGNNMHRLIAIFDFSSLCSSLGKKPGKKDERALDRLLNKNR